MDEGEGGGEDNAVRFKNKQYLQGKDEGQSCVWVSKKNRDELLNLPSGHRVVVQVRQLVFTHALRATLNKPFSTARAAMGCRGKSGGGHKNGHQLGKEAESCQNAVSV
jgi:hypothetical protein